MKSPARARVARYSGRYRPACRMIQTGVRSTGSRSSARRKRSLASGGSHLRKDPARWWPGSALRRGADRLHRGSVVRRRCNRRRCGTPVRRRRRASWSSLGRIVDRPDAGRDDDQPTVDLRAQLRGFQTRGDHAVRIRLRAHGARATGTSASTSHSKPRSSRSPRSRLVSAVTARILSAPLFAAAASMIGLIAVHRSRRSRRVAQMPATAAPTGRRNVEELEIAEDLVTATRAASRAAPEVLHRR